MFFDFFLKSVFIVLTHYLRMCYSPHHYVGLNFLFHIRRPPPPPLPPPPPPASSASSASSAPPPPPPPASRLPSPVSINLCLSTSLYRLVSINLSLSICLYQLVSINLSLPNCLYQLVCIHFSVSTWRGTWGHYSWSIAAIVAGDAAGRRGGLAAVRCRDCRRGRG